VIEHPRRNDDRGILCKRADEDVLASSLLKVVNFDVGTMRGMPRIVNLRVKCDMGRMTLDLL
jgi:hypothetical protein